MSARTTLWILAALLAGAAVVPVRSLDCPSWDVWVADQTGQPIGGATVRVSFRNYSAESRSHEVDETTDALGHVAFAPQTISASLGSRIGVTLLSAMAGVHASFGSHATVFAFAQGHQGFDVNRQRNTLVEWIGKPSHMESRITLQ